MTASFPCSFNFFVSSLLVFGLFYLSSACYGLETAKEPFAVFESSVSALKGRVIPLSALRKNTPSELAGLISTLSL